VLAPAQTATIVTAMPMTRISTVVAMSVPRVIVKCS